MTNGNFHRTRTKKFTIHMETQKTQNSQSSLEKEEWSWKNQPSWLQIILQSYSHPDSRVLAQKQKYRPMEQDRKTRNYKTLKRKTGRTLDDINQSKILYDPPPRVKEIKVNKWDLIKLKSFC